MLDLTLTPNATSVTVYEGAYSQICVTPDEVDRDAPAYFYVLFDDKHYTADSKLKCFINKVPLFIINLISIPFYSL